MIVLSGHLPDNYAERGRSRQQLQIFCGFDRALAGREQAAFDLPGPVLAPWDGQSRKTLRSSNFWILPVDVLGNS